MASITAPTGVPSCGPANTAKVVDELFVALDLVARKTLHAAGPRYSPSLDADAPNLEVVTVHRAASALALGSTFRSRLSTLGVAVANDNLSRSTTSTLFARRRITLDSLAAESDVASKLPLDELPAAVRKLRGHERRVREVLETAIEDARAKIAKIDRTEGTADVEVERARSQDKDRLQSRANDLRRRLEPLYDLQELLEGAEGVLASENRTMFLRGELGDRQDPLPV